MDDYIYYTILFDTYGALLTEKQQKYFKDYYFSNLSLSEIAENYQVSRNAIHNQLKDTKQILKHYEQVLHMVQKQQQLEEVCSWMKEAKAKQRIKEIIEI